jgi:hypothetical protein
MSFIGRARLGSLVLGTTDPEKCSAWYQAVFAPDEEVVDSVLRLSQGALIFERRDDVETSAREPGRIIINIQVDDLIQLKDHLKALELEWVRPVELIPVGLIATLRDVDGNFVNLLPCKLRRNPTVHLLAHAWRRLPVILMSPRPGPTGVPMQPLHRGLIKRPQCLHVSRIWSRDPA